MYLGSKITNQYGEGYIVSNVDPHNIKVVYEKTGEVKSFCRVRDCNCKEKYSFTSIQIPQNFKSDVYQANEELKYEIRKMQISLENKNKELDALHYVWCDGGCKGGMHRYTELPFITEDLIKRAKSQVRRMENWLCNRNYRNRINKPNFIHKILEKLFEKS